ncbi:hypothetical protein F5Y10DRAFT_110403 [Nemania abortiva]|nr:hypothetical protein F5Y10DRAFT_110403 [Nemania abortiva]
MQGGYPFLSLFLWHVPLAMGGGNRWINNQASSCSPEFVAFPQIRHLHYFHSLHCFRLAPFPLCFAVHSPSVLSDTSLTNCLARFIHSIHSPGLPLVCSPQLDKNTFVGLFQRVSLFFTKSATSHSLDSQRIDNRLATQSRYTNSTNRSSITIKIASGAPSPVSRCAWSYIDN